MSAFFIGRTSWFPKARKSFAGVLFGALVFLLGTVSSCGGDQIDVPDQPLQGRLDGNAWTSVSANAYRLPGGIQINVRFLSELEPVSDPCALPSPGLAHVRAIFRPAIGDFSVAPSALDENQVQVGFQVSPSTNLTAVSGFMSIFDINNGIIFGYLQAEIDDDHSVEGSFRINLCD